MAMLWPSLADLYLIKLYWSHELRDCVTQSRNPCEVVIFNTSLPTPVEEGSRSAWTEISGEKVESIRETSPFQMLR